MKLEKAKEVLQDLLKRYDFIDAKETHKALKLGIETINRELEYRESMPPKEGELLPGETEE